MRAFLVYILEQSVAKNSRQPFRRDGQPSPECRPGGLKTTAFLKRNHFFDKNLLFWQGDCFC